MWKIGQLAQRSGCSIETIRYYEQQHLLPKPIRCDSLTAVAIYSPLPLAGYPPRGDSAAAALSAAAGTGIQHIEHELQQQLLCLRAQCSGVRSAAACGILRGLAEAGGCQLSAEAQEQPPDTTSRGGG